MLIMIQEVQIKAIILAQLTLTFQKLLGIVVDKELKNIPFTVPI